MAHWGTFVTTPEVSEKLAKVQLDIQLENTTSLDRDVVVKSSIIDGSGSVVSKAESSLMAAKGVSSLTQDFELKNPVLWSPESPNLYQVKTVIIGDGKILDEYDRITSYNVCYTKLLR